MALTIVLLLLLAVVGVLVACGSFHWARGTRKLRVDLDSAAQPATPERVDFRALEGLPSPVQRYLRTVLKDGQQMVTGVHVRHRGTFNMGETGDRWRPFDSDQRVVTVPPGFDWEARIRMMPGLTVRVRDVYVAGEGILQATLLGLIPLVNRRGTGEIAEGELMRFLAEAAWYPTVLLPGRGVRWEAIDERSARAILVDGAVSVSMCFWFDQNGLIESVSADNRGRTVDGQVIPTPWRGRFRDYQDHGGMQVPVEGEVAWLLPEGAKPYWRGRITGIAYEFAK